MMSASIRRGAAQGAIAWLAYAVVETAFTVLLPWLTKPAHEYRDLSWVFTALLFLLYPAIGAAVGAIAGGIWTRAADVAGPLALCAAFVLFRHWHNFESWTTRFDVMVLLVAGGVLLSLRVGGLWFLRSPWLVAAFLAGVPVLVREQWHFFPRLERLLWLIAYIGFVLLAASVLSWRIGPGVALAKRAGVTLGLSVFTLALCLLPKAQPLVAPGGAPQTGATGQPNIVLITLDTVRADHLSLYGYQRHTTPNLEQFARDAIAYRHAFSAADMTLPSHGSLFTGVYASRHGAHTSAAYPFGRPLESSFPTLAEILKSKGYDTEAVVANSAYLQQAFKFQRGFRYYDDRRPGSFLMDTSASWMRQMVTDSLRTALPMNELGRVYRDAGTITSAAIAELDKARSTHRPLFLFLNYMDAHFPCSPPPPYQSMFPGRDPKFTAGDYLDVEADLMGNKHPLPPAVRTHLVSQYDGGIAYMDAQVAALFAHLKRTGLYDNTLIIVTADHGESFGDHNLLEHGGVSVYQEEVSVPLLIKYPHSRQRGWSEQPVSLVDILPTVLDLLGYERPAGLDGRSLLDGKLPPAREIIAECFADHDLASRYDRFNRDERAIYSWPLKFIASTRGSRELYNLESDPGETKDLYAKDSGAAQTLAASLHQWMAHAVRPVARPGALPQYRLDNLKSLGYVQ